MSRTTYDNEKTGGITVIVEDIDKSDIDEHLPQASGVKKHFAVKEKDDNGQRTGRKRGSVTVSSFYFHHLL